MKNCGLILSAGETQKNASYETFAFTPDKSKYGFVCINHEYEYVCHVAFNSAEDYRALLGCDYDGFSELENLKVGEQMELFDGDLYIRIW